ncbi:PKD domain-containing protein [Haloarcula laminariae]|uniref:PKD domain-containing protein n=1 Tax=Haloarcula laminariae TaxID=2961577 RepID=UPI0021C96C1E
MTVALLATAGTAVAADNTAPLADAGVDQTVSVNSTVYLDGNASVDPDGAITRVEWAIEAPDGATTTPDCVDCRRTEFDATTAGQYTVTLTVTDDDGAARSDTLYVTVTDETGPNVTLSGQSSTRLGTNTTIVANASNDDTPLQTITWLVNGTVAERNSLNGTGATSSFTHSFDSVGEVPVAAVVYDTLGERGRATRRVLVGNNGGDSCHAIWCGSEADMQYSYDGEQTFVDTNNDGKITTYQDSQLVDIDLEASNVKELGSNRYKIEGGPEAVSDQHKSPADSVGIGTGDSVDDVEDNSDDGGRSDDDDGSHSDDNDSIGSNPIGDNRSNDDNDDSSFDDGSSSNNPIDIVRDASDDDNSVLDDAANIVDGGDRGESNDDGGIGGSSGIDGSLF